MHFKVCYVTYLKMHCVTAVCLLRLSVVYPPPAWCTHKVALSIMAGGGVRMRDKLRNIITIHGHRSRSRNARRPSELAHAGLAAWQRHVSDTAPQLFPRASISCDPLHFFRPPPPLGSVRSLSGNASACIKLLPSTAPPFRTAA